MSAKRRVLTLAIATLLFALAPSLTYLGHWPSTAGAHSHGADVGGDHAEHCHENVAGCASGAASVGVPGLADESTISIAPDASQARHVSSVRAQRLPAFSTPATPPPRLAA